MKITLDIPDSTICGVFSYVSQSGIGLCLGTKSLSSEDIHDGAVLKAEPVFTKGDSEHE